MSIENVEGSGTVCPIRMVSPTTSEYAQSTTFIDAAEVAEFWTMRWIHPEYAGPEPKVPNLNAAKKSPSRGLTPDHKSIPPLPKTGLDG